MLPAWPLVEALANTSCQVKIVLHRVPNGGHSPSILNVVDAGLK